MKRTTIDGVNFTTDAKAQEQFLNLLQKISGLQLEFKGGYVKIKGSSGLPEYGNTLPGGLLGAALVAHMIDVDFDIDFVATSLDPVATPAAACNGNMTSAHVIDMTDILDWIDQREGAGVGTFIHELAEATFEFSGDRTFAPAHFAGLLAENSYLLSNYGMARVRSGVSWGTIGWISYTNGDLQFKPRRNSSDAGWIPWYRRNK